MVGGVNTFGRENGDVNPASKKERKGKEGKGKGKGKGKKPKNQKNQKKSVCGNTKAAF